MSGGVIDRILAHLSFNSCPTHGYRHIANQTSNFFGWQSVFCRQRSYQRIDLASGHLNRAPAAALSAGIDQVKRAWPAWLPGLDFGTTCKQIRRISQISYCQWSTSPRTMALPQGLTAVYIRRARRKDRTLCL
jgi:hypothetical protein